MTYDPRDPIKVDWVPATEEPLEPLHYEHERPSRRKPPYTGALAVVCMVMGLVGMGLMVWLMARGCR